jgi:hypothetical protein
LIKEDEAGCLRSSDSLANFFEIVAVKRYEVAEESGVTGSTRRRRLLAVDLSLNVERPFLRVLPTKECLIDIFPFSSDLGSPGTRF